MISEEALAFYMCKIESILQSRIEILERENHENKLILSLIRKSGVISKNAQKPTVNNPSTSISKRVCDDIGSKSNEPSLEDVLKMARSVRNPKSSKERKTVSTSESKISSTLDGHNQESQKSVNLNMESSAVSTDDFDLRILIVASLKQLGKQKLTSPSILLTPSKESFMQQSILLSKLHKCTICQKHPIFELIKQSCFAAIKRAQTTPQNHKQSMDDILTLIMKIRNVKDIYYKALQSRITRLKSTQLNENDKQEIITIWICARMICAKYQQITRMLQQLKLNGHVRTTEEELMEKFMKKIISLPFYTPINIQQVTQSNALFDRMKTKAWLINSVECVEQFHLTMHSNVKFVIENLISKFYLKEIIKRLKECCAIEIETINSVKISSSRLADVQKEYWTHALKLYRDVYCCLVKEAQNGSSCIFLNKSSKTS
jgi:hypothetical protein